MAKPHPFDYRVICDRTGFKMWSSETVMQWDGTRVGKKYLDEKPLILQVPNVVEDLNVPNARPMQADVLETNAYKTLTDWLKIHDS
jgi:hypothetical protein